MDATSQFRQFGALGGGALGAVGGGLSGLGVVGQFAPMVQPGPFISPLAACPQQFAMPLQQAVLTPSALTMTGIDAVQLSGAINSISNFQTLQTISNPQTSKALIDLATRALQPTVATRVSVVN